MKVLSFSKRIYQLLEQKLIFTTVGLALVVVSIAIGAIMLVPDVQSSKPINADSQTIGLNSDRVVAVEIPDPITDPKPVATVTGDVETDKELPEKNIEKSEKVITATVKEETLLEEPEEEPESETALSGTKEELEEERLVEEAEEELILTKPKEASDVVATVSRGSTALGGREHLGNPLSTLRITSHFGPRWGRFHQGTDFGMPLGAPIFAAEEGVVIFAGSCGTYGNLMKLDHGDGLITYYAHCSAFVVELGETVSRGETIAKIGSTGNSTGPHLHFEVLHNDKNINPLECLLY